MDPEEETLTECPALTDHHWLAIGTTLMTDAQAATWVEAEGVGYIDELIAVNLAWVTCLRCDASARQIGSECPGAPPSATPFYPHRWLATMSLELTDDEASTLDDPDAPLNPLVRPRVTNVVCGLCGTPAASADAVCPERRFWLHEARHPDTAPLRR
jgi:hypothetical protein